MTKINKFLLVLMLGLMTTATVMAQNMNRYITLTVQQGEQISLDLWADAANTPIKVVSGSSETTLTVGTAWTDFQDYHAGADTMTVYGNIKGFDCRYNGSKITALDASHNTALGYLFCYENNLNSLDVSGCTTLEYLYCNENNLNSLDVSGCTALEYLYCNENNLNSLDVSGCTALTDLYCYNNNLSSLDVSGCTALYRLYCYNNNLSSLDVSGCTALYRLYCYNNNLSSLDVSGCTALTDLYCYNNNLSSLDVSGCTALTDLYCYNNNLSSLDISSNTALTDLGCYRNNFTTQAYDDLMCSLPERAVADNAWFGPLYNASDANVAIFHNANSANAINKNWKVQYNQNGSKIPTTAGNYDCSGTNMNRYITLTVQQGEQISLNLSADAANTPVKIVSGSTDTTITVGTSFIGKQNYYAGADTMTVYGNIKVFDCSNNGSKITALDASHNTALEYLYCYENNLNSLDVSGCTTLEYLYCNENNLNSLDVSGCTALTDLYCYNNNLSSLDVSGCTALTDLYCSGNNLSSLALSNNAALTSLNCNNNNLSSIDVSGCTALTRLDCAGNNFTTQAYDDLMCSLPERTVAANAWFEPLYNASDANAATFHAANSANAINKNWLVFYNEDFSEIPATAGTFACPSLNMDRYITLTVQQGKQISLNLFADAANTPIKLVSGNYDTTLTAGTNWKGFKNYHAGAGTMTVYGNIKGFNCSDNGSKITALDPSHNTALEDLYCYGNNLSSLDVSHNTALEVLNCSNNNLSSLDVSHNTALEELYCSNNSLSSLDVSSNTALTSLWCYNNNLSSLDVSNNTALKRLDCAGNNFTTQAYDYLMCSLPERTGYNAAYFKPLYNASDANAATFHAANSANATNKNWQVLYLEDASEIPATAGNYDCSGTNMNRYITLTVQQGEDISLGLYADAENTPIKVVSGSSETTLTVGTAWTDFQDYHAGADTMTVYGNIKGFDCSGNGSKITALDASHNTALEELYCSNNSLSSLDISSNTALEYLDCNNNNISSIDVSGNTTLRGLDCSGNNLSSLDLSHNTALEILACFGNNFTTQAYDDLMCSLPLRETADNTMLIPLYDASDANAATFHAANSANAINKNWNVLYLESFSEIPATAGNYDCSGTNMNRYITLTVQQGEQISLDLSADAANTPVKIVSGSYDTTFTAGTNWKGFKNYHAGADTMTVYGNIKGFDCSNNGSKITALDASHNTALEELYCSNNSLSSLDLSSNTALTSLDCNNNNISSIDVSGNTTLRGLDCSGNNLSSLDLSHNTALEILACSGNNFTTQAYDDLMCSLPLRETADNTMLIPLYDASDANAATFHAANSANAINKNWNVLYLESFSEIPATAGNYDCSGTNMNRYITLTVQQGEQISLDLWADAANTPIKVVSGSSETTLTVGTAWTDFQFYHAGASTMTVYGNIIKFDCSHNGSKITALDASHNTALTVLSCSNNNLSALDLSNNSALIVLSCRDNNLSSLDLSHNTALEYLYCYGNNLSNLDLSHNTALTDLNCSDNNLSSLDISSNTALKRLYCYGNNFTTQAYDDLMCSLPERAVADNAWFEPLYNASDANVAIFHNANSANAINKNWKVQYYEDDSEIPATTGNYDCNSGINNIATITATLYPNPVKDLLNIISDSEITGYELYDALGRMLINKTNLSGTESVINLSSLENGIYILKLRGENGTAEYKIVKSE